MKKLTALVVLLTVIGTASFASSGPLGENSTFKVISKNDAKFELVYVSSEVGDVRVAIYNNEGRNVSSSTVKDASKFRRTFDFSQLEPGTYSVVVKNGDGTAREVIKYGIKQAKLQTFVTKIPDAKSLKLHVGDFNFDKPVEIKIYNSENKVVHSDIISNAKAFSRVYNMEKANSGDFTVVVENDGEYKSFTHTLQ